LAEFGLHYKGGCGGETGEVLNKTVYIEVVVDFPTWQRWATAKIENVQRDTGKNNFLGRCPARILFIYFFLIFITANGGMVVTPRRIGSGWQPCKVLGCRFFLLQPVIVHFFCQNQTSLFC
jgi:hypothetical protein